MATMAPVQPSARDVYRWRDPFESRKRYVLSANGDFFAMDEGGTVDIWRTQQGTEGWKWFMKDVVGLNPGRDAVKELSVVFGVDAESIDEHPLDGGPRKKAKITVLHPVDSSQKEPDLALQEEIILAQERVEVQQNQQDGSSAAETFKCKLCLLERPVSRMVVYAKSVCDKCGESMTDRKLKSPKIIQQEKQARSKHWQAKADKARVTKIQQLREDDPLIHENGYPLCLCGCGEPVTDVHNYLVHGHAGRYNSLAKKYESREIMWVDLPEEMRRYIKAARSKGA